ncbi:MAG TPA: response regulator [Polyangiaceae bacterium]|nr:response regulator [Polyangiaceae bacterium]
MTLPTHPPATIFLAEDDEDLRSVISLSLRDEGYEVVEAKDGAELLHLLADASAPSRRPDVIVSDVMMPGYSGLGLLTALHTSRWSVPVILITGCGDGRVVSDALRLGASAVLRKPFEIEELLRALRNASAPPRPRSAP